MKRETLAVHAGDRRKPSDCIPVTTPIYTAASYIYDRTEDLDKVFAGELDGPSYSRYDNPTRTALENLVTVLEGGHAALACASGMSALHLALVSALIDRPRRILAANMLYGATTNMLMNIFGPMGIDASFVDMCDLAALEQALDEARPAVVVIETVSNPLLRVTAMDSVAALCRARSVPLVVDNTFASPILVQPLALGANYSVHSTTKYLAGHGDVLGGVVITDQEHWEPMKTISRTLGPVMSPFEAYLTMRGVKTLPLRIERQCANACRVAAWLKDHPQVERVYFTGDPAHPDAASIQRLFPKGLYGAMVAFEIAGAAREQIFAFMDALRLVVRATSLGDVHSMILYPAMASHRDLAPKQRQRLGINDNLVRISIGIEAHEDVIDDLSQAFESIR
jgi:cystathionine gamma-synthase/methionine-gamma-lyase